MSIDTHGVKNFVRTRGRGTRLIATFLSALLLHGSGARGDSQLLMPSSDDVPADLIQRVVGGSTTLALNRELLDRVGVQVFQLSDRSTTASVGAVTLPVSPSSTVALSWDAETLGDSATGRLIHGGGVLLVGPAGEVRLAQFIVDSIPDPSTPSAFAAVVLDVHGSAMFGLLDRKVAFDHAGSALHVECGSLTAMAALADALGAPRLAGAPIGALWSQVDLELRGSIGGLEDVADENDGGVAGGNNGTDCWHVGEPNIGPDVIVGVITGICNFDTVGGIDAFSIGTTSCNIGSSNLSWQGSPDQDHPVIGQNIFKLKNDRFEQIGQSWLKHGFTALTLDDCGCGCSGVGGSVLGVGCSDPYGCGLNGSQSGLGAKSDINPHLGTNLGNHDTSSGSSIYKRSQVAVSDLEPSSASVRYFAEGHYIAADDAAAGKDNNNASYIALTVSGSGSAWNASSAGPTVREQAGIRAWKDTDPTVTETDVQISGEGLIIVAAKATDLGTGFWHYEYALQNLNSDRSVGSFSVPIDIATAVMNIGFHDVPYHSGEPYDGTDWAGTPGGGMVSWSTTPFAVDQNANALRWGTLYNFRFDANRVPVTGNVTIGLFKPGAPASVTAMSVVPNSAPVTCITNPDCNDTLFCTGVEVCVAGFCQPGSAPCADLCDETLDACVECLSNFDCDDGDFCNGAETCSAGACVNGADPCTLFCDEAANACLDCLTNVHCDDDTFCNGAEVCAGGTCVAAGGGVINGTFTGTAGWTNNTPVGGTITYPNNLDAIGGDDGVGGIAWANQPNVLTGGANLQFDLLSYTSTDTGAFDYPVLMVNGTAYGLNANGTVGVATFCTSGSSGSITNSTPAMNVHFSVDLATLAGAGPYDIGFGVCTTDGIFGPGIAVFDNVLPPVTPADPCPGQCCNEIGNACAPCNVCGNGLIESAEECDDGNLVNGDGCSSICESEPLGFPCPNGALDCLQDPANNACNCARCVAGVCTYVCGKYADSNCDGIINLDTTLCVLAAFTSIANCPESDVYPCGGDGIISIDDILGELRAFAGANLCGCQQFGAPPLCGSIEP